MSKNFLVLIIVSLLILGFLGYLLFGKSEGKSFEERVILSNPVEGLSNEVAVERFDESFVLYLLYSLGVDKLKNPPLSSEEPKIVIYVGEDIYSGLVRDGGVGVGRGQVEGPDIIIRTTASEVVQMLRDRNYVVESFAEGKSGVVLVAGKVELGVKGYLGLYRELTG